MNTKRGYLASVLLAGVMIAGYLGMLPLLQSLAAEPAWPVAPPAAAGAVVAPQGITVQAAPVKLSATRLASSRPSKSKSSKKNNAKAAKRTTQRTGTPARATGSTSTNSNDNRDTRPSAQDFGSGSGSDGLASDPAGGNSTCVGISGC